MGALLVIGRIIEKSYRRFVGKKIQILGHWVLRFFIFPFYKQYSVGKRFLTKFYHPSGNAFWDVLTNRYIIHAIIIVIGIFVITDNINARVNQTRDQDYGKQSMLYQLIGGDELVLIEETQTDGLGNESNIINYLDEGLALSTDTPQFSPSQIDQDLATITPGGLALVKPDISPSYQGRPSLASGQAQDYIVQNGDTIASISARFGISAETILWENNLSAKSYIRPGDTLRILATTGVTHTVARGETLSRIAKLYDISEDTIIRQNNLSADGGIAINQKLIIPGGKKIISTTTTKTVASRTTATNIPTKIPAGATLSGTRLEWPTTTRTITQYFKWQHTGLDIASRQSPPIFAAEAGTVVDARASGYNGGYGSMVIIDHGNGLRTLYGHLAKLYVSNGDVVSRGQTIGIMGSTGRSTGPHVHFEVRVNGTRVNPLNYIR